MSDLPMQQVNHPAHNVPDATEAYSGDTLSDRIDYAMAQTRNDYDPDLGGKLIDTGIFKRHAGAFPPKGD